jgi:hypothetical protein
MQHYPSQHPDTPCHQYTDQYVTRLLASVWPSVPSHTTYVAWCTRTWYLNQRLFHLWGRCCARCRLLKHSTWGHNRGMMPCGCCQQLHACTAAQQWYTCRYLDPPLCCSSACSQGPTTNRDACKVCTLWLSSTRHVIVRSGTHGMCRRNQPRMLLMIRIALSSIE